MKSKQTLKTKAKGKDSNDEDQTTPEVSQDGATEAGNEQKIQTSEDGVDEATKAD